MHTLISIATIQCAPIWNDKAGNLLLLRNALQDVQADIIVLPELCTTGYSFLTPEEAFEAADTADEVAAFFLPIAQAKNAVIVAGFAEKDGEQVYNSAITVLPDNSFHVYRKTHLFFKETLCFSPGDTGFKVVQHPYKDCCIGAMVCYDWRFPESARSLALQGADIICVPANLVTTVWETGMKARALENNVYVAVANRCGSEKRTLAGSQEQVLHFNGKSVVYNTEGNAIVQLSESEEDIAYANIDVSISRDKYFNAYNNIFNDRRPHLYHL